MCSRLTDAEQSENGCQRRHNRCYVCSCLALSAIQTELFRFAEDRRDANEIISSNYQHEEPLCKRPPPCRASRTLPTVFAQPSGSKRHLPDKAFRPPALVSLQFSGGNELAPLEQLVCAGASLAEASIGRSNAVGQTRSLVQKKRCARNLLQEVIVQVVRIPKFASSDSSHALRPGLLQTEFA